jgi:maleylpyruvate isomerase
VADLELARRATAYFARVLNGFDDGGLDGPSLQPDLSRRQIIAAVGLQARRMAETIAWHRRTSDADPEPGDFTEAATLPPHALRHLVTHAAVHLNVEWRDMTDADWPALDHLPRLRAQSLWRASLALGARLKDLPAGLIEDTHFDPRAALNKREE